MPAAVAYNEIVKSHDKVLMEILLWATAADTFSIEISLQNGCLLLNFKKNTGECTVYDVTISLIINLLLR